MKVPTHIIGHYHRSVRRYKKIIARIRQNHDSSSYQYRNLVQALRKKIAALHFQLKIPCTTGVLALNWSINPSNAQSNIHPFTLQPLRQLLTGFSSLKPLKKGTYPDTFRQGIRKSI